MTTVPSRPTTVLVASDKFKGSLTAAQVAAAVSAGIRRVSDARIMTVPVADGGDGTVEAAVSAGFERVLVTASGPTGEPVETAYARRGDTAVIEMADVSGLVRLPGGVRRPLTASSRGLGEVIGAAIDAGCTQIIVGIGGSASTDGGAGLVSALGARLLDADGEDLDAGGVALADLDRIDLGALRSRLEGVSVTVASDVDNPLLGERGAAAVYGPQKGASMQDVERLDAALAHWADLVEEVTGRDDRHHPGAGAAGGVGFGLIGVLGAQIRSGIDLLLELVGFDAALAQLGRGDLVITGEGSLDEQTLHGKAPAGVAQAAAARGIPVVAVCGRTTLDAARLKAAGIDAVYALSAIEPDPRRCFAEAGPLLEQLAERLAAAHLTPSAKDGVVDVSDHGETFDLLIRAARVMLPDGQERAADIGVRGGTIVAVEPAGSDLVADAVLELEADEVLLPGVVDSHVHVNDPGRTEWEGFTSATRAAAAGGVTTIVDMPLNSIPPTVDVSALEIKRKTADGQCWVDVGFWGGAVPGNLEDLAPLHEAGVFGFKCFLIHSGVDEFPHLQPDEVAAAMREIAAFDGFLIVHAEDPDEIEHAPDAHGPAYQGFLESRPRDAENRAIEHLIAMSRETGCRVHILHVSSSDALPTIAAAEADGVRISAETCPHYLTFTSEEIPAGGTQYKCCPPIREAANRDLLWEGLRDGTIDIVVSDHSPSTIDLKRLDTGDFGEAWGGISSLQLGLSAVWTEARKRGFTLADVVRWMSSGPAELVGLTHKGRIAVGADADFCVFAPDGRSVVDVTRLHHKNAITPYAGRTLDGVVRSTWLRGIRIDVAAPPRGRLLTRGS